MTAPDITVTINFHREGALAVPALASLADVVSVARAAGIVVETQAVLDRVDDLTRHVVAVRGDWLDRVEEVSFGDLGRSRNAGTGSARGRFLSFLDGDDLWGDQWLRAAFAAATEPSVPASAIWHPEHHYAFTEADLDQQPEAGTAVYQRMLESDTPGFNVFSLAFNSFWSANAFAARDIFFRFPYHPIDRDYGIGIEDWSWNWATIAAGIPHRVVPHAVHIIRRKRIGSLMQKNTMNNLAPEIPDSFRWGPDGCETGALRLSEALP
jgi:hypothetical protein